MTDKSTQPADLLALPTKLRNLAGVIRKYGTCAPMALETLADELESLAAHRGEVEPVAWLYSNDKGERRVSLTRWHPITVEPCGVTETPLYPPQAQAGAGDSEVMARAWRNRFIDERMNAYPEAGYEMRRCYAETDANNFETAFRRHLEAKP